MQVVPEAGVVRHGRAVDAASRSGRDHGRRDSRPGNGPDRDSRHPHNQPLLITESQKKPGASTCDRSADSGDGSQRQPPAFVQLVGEWMMLMLEVDLERSRDNSDQVDPETDSPMTTLVMRRRPC